MLHPAYDMPASTLGYSIGQRKAQSRKLSTTIERAQDPLEPSVTQPGLSPSATANPALAAGTRRCPGASACLRPPRRPGSQSRFTAGWLAGGAAEWPQVHFSHQRRPAPVCVPRASPESCRGRALRALPAPVRSMGHARSWRDRQALQLRFEVSRAAQLPCRVAYALCTRPSASL